MIFSLNRLVYQISFLLLLGFLALPTDTFAGDVIYAIDTSPMMAKPCNGSSNKIDAAREWIKNDAFNHHDRISIITLGSRPPDIFHQAENHSKMADALDSINIGNSDLLSLAPSLKLIQNLISAGTVSIPRIVFISDSKPLDEDSIQLILMLQQVGTKLEWISVESAVQADQLATLGFVRTHNLACTINLSKISISDPDPEIVQLIRVVAAEQSGLDLELVLPNSDLVNDLGLDHLGAFEVLARTCEMLSVALPDISHFTKIVDIAKYLSSAPKENSRRIRGDSSLNSTEPAYIQTVYFGTNRSPDNGSKSSSNFNGERAIDKRISYGVCHVSIPVLAHEKGKVESPFLGLDILTDPKST